SRRRQNRGERVQGVHARGGPGSRDLAERGLQRGFSQDDPELRRRGDLDRLERRAGIGQLPALARDRRLGERGVRPGDRPGRSASGREGRSPDGDHEPPHAGLPAHARHLAGLAARDDIGLRHARKRRDPLRPEPDRAGDLEHGPDHLPRSSRVPSGPAERHRRGGDEHAGGRDSVRDRDGRRHRPAGGKTGTGQNYQDAWFIGYVPQLATGVWVGYAKGELPMPSVPGYGAGFGGTLAAPIWHDFMLFATQNMPVLYFPPPPVSFAQASPSP